MTDMQRKIVSASAVIQTTMSQGWMWEILCGLKVGISHSGECFGDAQYTSVSGPAGFSDAAHSWVLMLFTID